MSGKTASRPEPEDERAPDGRPVWNVTGIARHFTVSRPTIYKLIDDRTALAAHLTGR